MTINFNNKYDPSSLVSKDFLSLLEKAEPMFLRLYSTNTGPTKTFDDGTFSPGEVIGYTVNGVPPITRGPKLKITSYEQRKLYIKADAQRWTAASTRAFDLLDKIFYLSDQDRMESISGPTLGAIMMRFELEAIQYALEHSPIIPAFGADIDQPITVPGSFSNFTVNWLRKLRQQLSLKQRGYTLVLNSDDQMELANSLQTILNPAITGLTVKTGMPPNVISDFPLESTIYLTPHYVAESNGGTLGPLVITQVPLSDEMPLATIKNNSNVDLTLKAGDIIYYKAPTGQKTGGLNWIEAWTKMPVVDARYSFVVTSDKYIADLESQGLMDDTFQYSDVVYTIPAGQQLPVSLSHRPISSGEHQNCSRTITGTDEFWILESHRKNLAVCKDYLFTKNFKFPKMYNTTQHMVYSPKTKINISVSYDRVLQEGQNRGNLFDYVSMSCFGAAAQSLFTLPGAI